MISRQTATPAPHSTAPRLACIGLLATLFVSLPAHAATTGQALPTPDLLAQLELRASHAAPREQCFLYTQLVHAMAQVAGQQVADGDTQQATETLRQIDHYTRLIHLNLARDTKRLKDAQELIHNTTYRLADVLHLVSGQDRATVQETLQQLDQLNQELLTQIFAH